tara:strand:+ start:28408 stop:28641 length:234 start_codon:yes stop_codon:yes gene_type:complete
MKKTLSIAFSLLILSASVFTYSAFAKNDKVLICHDLGDGNGNGEYILIEVSAKGAVAHLSNHDDYTFFGAPCGLLIQ